MGGGGEVKRRKHTWYSRLVLLLWKNMLLRRRHWVLSLFEVLLPTLLFALLVTVRVLPDSVFTPTIIDETTVFEPSDESLLRELFCNDSRGFFFRNRCFYPPPVLLQGARKFLYGPANTFTQEIVTRLRKDLWLYKADFMLVDSNEDMNDQIDTLYLQTNESFAPYFVGMFFHLDDPASDVPPSHLSYDLRMQKYWYTDAVFPYLQIPGPRNFTGNYPNLGSYASGGFSLLQTLLDRHYIAMVSGNAIFSDTVEVETQMYPYPPYVQDNGMSQFYGASLPTFVVLSLVLLSPTLIKSIVHEKETGVRELVRLMGLEGWLVWLGWFLHSFIMIIVVAGLMTFFLKVKVTSADAGGTLPPIFMYTDPFLLWVILTVYGISSIAFCFAISCFFNKPTLATTMGILIWMLSYYIPRGIMDSQYDTMDLAPKVISCLLPNMAITWAFRIIGMFEGRALGVHWNNLWETGNPRDELTMGMILIMMVADIFLYFLITWYVDKVLPGKYGVPLRWNFPFKASFWRPQKQRPPSPPGPNDSPAHSRGQDDEADNFEEEPTHQKPGIVITNLRKEFPALGGGVKVAVADVSLTCYEGQCTVLLGHNGAGKTTTMSVITGVYPASGGTAEILGHDIHTNLKKARADIGLCPQHNTLFADLSVMQHLLFFAQLKGLTRSSAEKEAEQLLQRMQLSGKKDQFGNQLSGGMQRKLCLCIALVGGSKVVILDEPSSGLDPESRRWVWDTVQQERGTRTVLVTTHHMEEADVLGDRIAIMAAGRVVCSGSTLFLKNRFGDGYSLRVLPLQDCNVRAITSTVQSVLPESVLSSNTEEELLYNLENNTKRFPILLQELTDKKKLLKINHVGLSLTSMEQVFLRVGETFDPEIVDAVRGKQTDSSTSKSGKKEKPVDPSTSKSATALNIDSGMTGTQDDDTRYLFNSQFNIDGKLSGTALVWERLSCLWVKRIIYSKRKWVLLLTQGLVPVITTLMCLAVDMIFFGENAVQPSRALNLTMFDWSMSFVEEDTALLEDLDFCYQDQFSDPYQIMNTTNVTASLVQTGIDDEFHYRENHVTSALFHEVDNKTVTRMLYQSVPLHAPGVGINLISNALLQCATAEQADQDYLISTFNYPLPIDKRYRLDEDNTSGSALVYAMMMPLGLAFLSASFLVFPLQERVSKAKQIQVMTGTSVWALWFTSFTWDLLCYVLSSLLVFIFFVALDPQGNFTLDGAPGALFVLLLLYGWSSIPLAYLFSFPYSTAASGFAILTLVNIVAGMIITVATWALNSSEQPSLLVLSNVLGNITSFIPAYPASLGFKNLLDVATYNTQCDIVDPALVVNLCDSLIQNDIDSPYLFCCPQCSTLNTTCFEPVSYYHWQGPGLGRSFAWMLGDGVAFFFLLYIIESGIGEYIRNGCWKLSHSICKKKMSSSFAVPADEDVLAETQLARTMMAESNPKAALVVDGLTKEFVKVGLTAVNNVSFRVDKGECFGLLGVNGAGKTTTFKMLTADETPTSGDARIGNSFLSQGRSRFVQEIGYCPQFDAILEELTGEEMLMLLAGLRGVPLSRRKRMMKEFVELVDLTECYKRQSSTYSGGNKRKLSTAMALVGGPPLVFLDEPTTGVDPASRRRVWSAIRAARANGQSIILTSHSMDECEALCSRIVILVRGQLRCAGTPGHLKAKFNQGYSLQVKLRSHSVDRQLSEKDFETSLSRLLQIIPRKLPGAELTDQHRGMLSYLVPPSISWAEVFSTMEDLKEGSKEDLVEDYAATEPSLEQVFLAFAREADNSLPDQLELVTHL